MSIFTKQQVVLNALLSASAAYTVCSTAWLPARVVESLNKNVDGLNGIPSHPQHQPQLHLQLPRFNVSEYGMHKFCNK